MSTHAVSLQSASAPRIEYRPFDAAFALANDVLAAIMFGDGRFRGDDPRFLTVGLPQLQTGRCMEIWLASGAVDTGREGPIRYAADANFQFGAIEMDERAHGGIAGATQAAYAALHTFLRGSKHAHLLRVWNYFGDINSGAGDSERYKQFCVGRAAGLNARPAGDYPAATVIGGRGLGTTLQIYWLAGRYPGEPLENPRQTTPNRYPREYGPVAPQFSRAMLISHRLVLVSGTASIVGHASRHPGDLQSQLDETLDNIVSVLQKAASHAPGLPTTLGERSLLKIYLRHPAHKTLVETRLRERLPPGTPYLLLEGDICRSDLLVESDCVQADR